MRKFKLITQIDRINYLSDNYISYYRNFFELDEFYFLVHYVNFEIIRSYLINYGFSENQLFQYDARKFGWGDNITLQNETKQKFLNEGYVVLYADIDERIFHPNLREYISDNLKKWIIPTGISLMQHPTDKPLDETKKVLDQRNYCKIDVTWFSKTCVLAEDYEWTPGRHNRPHGAPISGNVYLVDIGKMCKDFMLKNNAQSREIYKTIFWRYSDNKKESMDKVFLEHRGEFIKIPEVIKNSMLF